MELNSVILTTGSSVGFFKLVNYGLGKLPIPETARRNAWKWNNISTSFVHSLITGVWSVLCFCMHPQMAEDLIETHSVFSHALVSVSIGYFIYDFLDMVINQKIIHSWELLFHHVVVSRSPTTNHSKGKNGEANITLHSAYIFSQSHVHHSSISMLKANVFFYDIIHPNK